jgi:serine protease Do
MPRQFGSRPFGGDRGEEGGGAKRIALGSGFIIDASGTIVTNNHVVGEAAKVEVTLQDNSKYTARIVGRDSRTDIAVLKIKADKPLPHVSFGDSNAAATSMPANSTISCRSTHRSTAAIPAARPST